MPAAWFVFPGAAGMILALLIWFWTALRAASAFAESKQNGFLELLLTTPITVDNIVKGQWLALWKSIQVPVYCLLALMIATVALASSGPVVQSAVLVEILLQIAVIGAVGMWMGLSAKSRAKAVVNTILLGVLLPWMALCLFTLPAQIALFFRALNRTKFILNRMRRGGHTLGLQDLLRGTNTGNPNMPPVIRHANAPR